MFKRTLLKHASTNTLRLFSVSLLSAALLVPTLSIAQDEDAASEKEMSQTLASIDSVLDENAYEFQSEDRPSPFVPFLRSPPEALLPDEILEVTHKLEGLQLFEPPQLRLTGIIARPSGFSALIADPAGRGYIAKVGTSIGRRGTILEINENSVQIRETYKLRSGTEKSKDLTMKLN